MGIITLEQARREWEKEQRKKKRGPKPPGVPYPNWSEDELAQRLVAENGSDIRFDHTRGRWLLLRPHVCLRARVRPLI